jgi:hypothetical protein
MASVLASTARPAAARVGQLWELIEAILCQYYLANQGASSGDLATVEATHGKPNLSAHLVSRKWHNVYTTSQSLRQALFLEPSLLLLDQNGSVISHSMNRWLFKIHTQSWGWPSLSFSQCLGLYLLQELELLPNIYLKQGSQG